MIDSNPYKHGLFGDFYIGIWPHILDYFVAVNCGPVVNPDPLVAQIEGAVIMALSTALKEEVKFATSGVVFFWGLTREYLSSLQKRLFINSAYIINLILFKNRLSSFILCVTALLGRLGWFRE